MMNVSRILRSPRFQQTFTVNRITGQFGVGAWIPDDPVPISMQGVVIPTTPKDIDQLPEGDRITESRTFYTTQAIYVTHNDATPGTSDQITYQGFLYRLAHVKNYSDYGYWKGVGLRMSGD